jgi:hypothetical protein
MRHVREVLRLRTAGISGNEIARRLNLAPSTVRLTLQRLATAELAWPLPAELTDAALEARLFTTVGTKQGHRRQAEPEWAEVHRELMGVLGAAIVPEGKRTLLPAEAAVNSGRCWWANRYCSSGALSASCMFSKRTVWPGLT